MKMSLILSVDGTIPISLLNTVVEHHRRTLKSVEIIISSCGVLKDTPNSDKVACVPNPFMFNLSRTRNAGARVSSCDWLVFCDIDTVLRPVLDEMVNLLSPTSPAIRGVSRQDVPLLDGCYAQDGPYYKCANSPIIVERKFFESIGGYCERYNGWGYEDSDFEHKMNIPIIDFDSKSCHVMEIHDIVSIRVGYWNRGSDQNQSLFESRVYEAREDRIEYDRKVYSS